MSVSVLPPVGAFASRSAQSPQLESFSYDDEIVRKFLWATFIWGLVGMLVGLLIALQLANPIFNTTLEWLSFGRLRPLHTNAVIFAFAGNAILHRRLLLDAAPAQGADVLRRA